MKYRIKKHDPDVGTRITGEIELEEIPEPVKEWKDPWLFDDLLTGERMLRLNGEVYPFEKPIKFTRNQNGRFIYERVGATDPVKEDPVEVCGWEVDAVIKWLANQPLYSAIGGFRCLAEKLLCAGIDPTRLK